MVNIETIVPMILSSMFWVFIGGIVFLFFRQWNIPVTVLRFTGNKGRPTLIHKKAKKRMIKGVPYLWVRGYSDPIRDFVAENYYPSPRSKWGGLVLWEFEDGWLTPVIPKAVKKDAALKKRVDAALGILRNEGVMNFDYDPLMHKNLQFQIIDDVDSEFVVNERMRQDEQYRGGLMDFLNRHATTMLVLFMGVLLLVGWIIYWKNAPDWMASCAGAAKDAVTDTLLQQAADRMVPPG